MSTVLYGDASTLRLSLLCKGRTTFPPGRVNFKRYASVDDLFADLELIEERMDGQMSLSRPVKERFLTVIDCLEAKNEASPLSRPCLAKPEGFSV